MTNTPRIVGVAMLAALVLGGCHSTNTPGPPTPSTTPPVEQLHPRFSFVWSADAGVDLFSRPAELIRATHEARFLTNVYGPDKTFPGYIEAVGGLKNADDSNYRFTVTSKESADWVRIVSLPQTYYMHMTDLHVSPDGSHISTYACGHYSIPPDFPGPVHDPGGPLVSATIIELSNPNPDRQPSSVADTDPAVPSPLAEMPPTWNVFGSWRITKIYDLLPDKIPQKCKVWRETTWPTIVTREPVKPQFPEWIKLIGM